jgi:hypothetical protein
MVAIGVLGLTVMAVVVITGYLIWRKKKLAEAQAEIHRLNVARDTARIVEEYKRKEVEMSWEDFDRQQWELRFKNGSVE